MKSQINVLFGFIVIILNLSSCKSANNTESGTLPGYNLKHIDSKLVLPDILLEVSGVTEIDEKTVACIQDENGILFIYDINQNKIINQYKFDIDGDYEGIARVENTIYILRSDGALIEISRYNKPDFSMSIYLTGAPASDNEGLCYDASQNRLLIACKSKIAKGQEFKDIRAIYAFDLKTKKLSDEPIYEFNTDIIRIFAIEHKIKLPVKIYKKKNKNITEPNVKLRISAIGIHPITGDLYVLSATGFMLLVLDKTGGVKNIEKLNARVFNQAEGITFLKNGDMLITNEGQLGKPNLLRFNYSEKQ
jgi:uncharacterized protein YjiK